jgi:aryl-alcohol dehydrogenase-like predicted oxidoreductase
VFGPPTDRDEAIRLLREAIEMGVDHIDTAQCYGPDVANQLIRGALHPYPPGLILVSKVGAGRDSRGGILFQDAGFFTIDLGDLITGGQMQQVGAPLAGANLIRLPDPS